MAFHVRPPEGVLLVALCAISSAIPDASAEFPQIMMKTVKKVGQPGEPEETGLADITTSPFFEPLPPGADESTLDPLGKFLLAEIHHMQKRAAALGKEKEQLTEQLKEGENPVEKQIDDLRNNTVEQEKLTGECNVQTVLLKDEIVSLNEQVQKILSENVLDPDAPHEALHDSNPPHESSHLRKPDARQPPQRSINLNPKQGAWRNPATMPDIGGANVLQSPLRSKKPRQPLSKSTPGHPRQPAAPLAQPLPKSALLPARPLARPLQPAMQPAWPQQPAMQSPMRPAWPQQPAMHAPMRPAWPQRPAMQPAMPPSWPIPQKRAVQQRKRLKPESKSHVRKDSRPLAKHKKNEYDGPPPAYQNKDIPLPPMPQPPADQTNAIPLPPMPQPPADQNKAIPLPPMPQPPADQTKAIPLPPMPQPPADQNKVDEGPLPPKPQPTGDQQKEVNEGPMQAMPPFG